MGRMKLKGKEYILIKPAFKAVLDWDKERREEKGSSWYIGKEDNEYIDKRPKAEELYEYLKGLPERSWQSRKAAAEKDWKVELYDRYIEEGNIPKEMTVKVDENNYTPFEWTLCAFVTYHFFKNEEAYEIVNNVLDRLLLHKRRSAGGSLAYISRIGGDTSGIENPYSDRRDPEHHIDKDESGFTDLEKIGKSEQESKRKIPPRLSDQQKFILVKLFQEGGEYRKGELSKEVALEFDTDGSRFDSGFLSQSHSASFSRTLARLEDRDLLTVSIHFPPNYVELTAEGEKAGNEIEKRAQDGRYSLNFERI